MVTLWCVCVCACVWCVGERGLVIIGWLLYFILYFTIHSNPVFVLCVWCKCVFVCEVFVLYVCVMCVVCVWHRKLQVDPTKSNINL